MLGGEEGEHLCPVEQARLAGRSPCREKSHPVATNAVTQADPLCEEPVLPHCRERQGGDHVT